MYTINLSMSPGSLGKAFGLPDNVKIVSVKEDSITDVLLFRLAVDGEKPNNKGAEVNYSDISKIGDFFKD